MIKDLRVYPVLNSKGKPTLKVKIKTGEGFYSASVPSGTSKGKNEAKDIPFKKVGEILPKIRGSIIGLDESDWVTADQIIEQIENSNDYSNMGVSLALGISLAVAKASTYGELWRLRGAKTIHSFPYPLGNVMGGGEHGGKTTWQEFLVLPHKAKTPMEATEINYEVWSVIGEELKRKGLLLCRNIENAWCSKLDDLKTLDLVSSVAEDFGARIGIDFAASSFWNGRSYVYKNFKKNLTPEKQMEMVARVAEVYDVYYLEDPLHEEDFAGFTELNKRLRGRLLVGDDLYCTNFGRVKKGIEMVAGNAAIIKPNQYGTLFQVSRVIKLMKNAGFVPVMSHRSGETEDYWLSDLALAWDSPIIKIGNFGPDMPKHNRLLELWNDVHQKRMARLPGKVLEDRLADVERADRMGKASEGADVGP